jgi:hypothetical protein
MAHLAVMIAIVVASVAALVAGVRLRRPRQRLVALAVVLTLVAVRWAFYVWPAWQLPLGRFPAYAHLLLWWLLPALALLMGLAVGCVPRSRRALYLGLACFPFVWLSYAACAVASTDYAAMAGTPDNRGLVRQSTDYTCGPAVGASLLGHHGIACSEANLARIARPTRYTGTNPFMLAVAINQHAAERDASLQVTVRHRTSIDWHHLPVLVAVELTPLVGHWLMVLEHTDEDLTVFDPMTGIRGMTLEEYHDRVLPLYIAVERP